MSVNTASVAERRKLRFASLIELQNEIDSLVAAEQAGKLRAIGNWTLGQAFGHLAAWIEYGYSGYPFKTPWLMRVILRLMVKGMLRNGMPAGKKIPNSPDGTWGTEKLATDDGAKRLRAAIGRLAAGEIAKYDSPAFGPMSHEDRVLLGLRHAELHLGFFVPL